MHEAVKYGADALAIVGLGLRLPGGISTLDELWSALSAGRDLITDPPPERFDVARFLDRDPGRAGKSYSFAGGYIGDVAGFDAGYFGISPREAGWMDPQQRLLLELTAEAFDDAAIDPASVARSNTAVFVGMSDMAYMGLQMMTPERITGHTMSGGVLSIASNRLSYVYDLRGPSMTIDTACSSAMVALHQACQAVLSGRCSMAVVGGVHLLLNPYAFVGFAKATMLSPSGRCATFSAEADGYVRAEGGGVFLIKRLADALATNDRVHAVILGTHANADGRTSGMAVPSVEMQEELLRQVYERAQVHPDQLVYFEAHGTGTPVGDPRECEAIGRALGSRRRAGHRLPIGSVKTNLGHMEPASGVSGILKALLVLRHRIIPRSLHGDPPNPLIDFAALGLAPVTTNHGIGDGPAVVGVNSFGFGGANAHAVLAEPPEPAARDTPQGEPPSAGRLPMLVSAACVPALHEAGEQLVSRLREAAPADFYDICHTASRRRGAHRHRAVVFAATPGEAAERLAGVVTGAEPVEGAIGRAASDGRIVFVFSGNGSQWPTMGADLLNGEPVFRAAVERVDRELERRIGWSVLAELMAPAQQSRMADTAFAQPTLFALQIGLVELLAARGVRPAAVIGHSVGEVAAAWAAGALDLESACQVIAGRSEAQASTVGGGRMAAVGLSEQQAEEILDTLVGRLAIAAVNSGQDVTVSGARAAVAELASRLDASVFFRELDVDYAFHSEAMEVIEEPFRESLVGLLPSAATVPFVSTVTGTALDGTKLDGSYWWDNVRQPVRFAQAVDQLVADGFGIFLEVGPHPVLAGYLRRLTESTGTSATISTLRRGADGTAAISSATTALMVAGADIDYAGYFPRRGRVVDLPRYPWQRERHWHGTPGQWIRSSGDGTIDHPLLGERMPLLEPTWVGAIEPARVPWLAAHRVLATVLMPIVGLVELALAAGRRIYDAPVEIDDLAIPVALPLPWGAAMDVRIQTSVSRDDGAIRIASNTGGDEWRLHAQGRVRRLLCGPPPPMDVSRLQREATEHLDKMAIYDLLERTGMNYGPDFQLLNDVYAGEGQVLAHYHSGVDQSGYEVHPAILDGAFQAGAPLLTLRSFLPGAIDRVRLWRQPASSGVFHVRQRSQTSRELCWDVAVADEDGTVVAELRGCRMRRVVGEKAPPARGVTVMRAATRNEQPRSVSPSPGPAELVAEAQDRITELLAAWHRQGWDQVEQGAKTAMAHQIMAAVNDLLPSPGEFATEDLLAAGMLAKHGRWWQLAASMCEHAGLVVPNSAGGWRATATAIRTDLWGDLLRTFPQFSGELVVWGRFGAHLSDLLCGRCAPVDLLFGDSGPDAIEHFYDTAPICRLHNGLAVSLVQAMVAAWPADRPLRVLEVGAGTGGMTGALLTVLPPDRCEYLFTDVSAAFFPSAKTRFKGYDFLEYRCVDLERDLQQQGLTEASFDLIVASNVVHATRDVRRCLHQLGSLLVENGQLLTVETHDPELVVVFGLMDEFWSFTDTDLRPESAFLSRDEWPPVFRQCGFDEVVQVGDDREPGRGDISVILGRHVGRSPVCPELPTAEATASWLILAEDPVDLDVASALAAALRGAGGAAVVAIDDDRSEWALRIAPGESIVYLLGGEADSDGAAAVARAGRRAGVLRAFSHACRCFRANHRTSFCLVTRPSGALPEPERPSMPADAAMWGAARSWASERTDINVARISWDRGGDLTVATARLARELLSPSAEDEVVLTAAGRFVPRQVEGQRPRRTLRGHERSFEAQLRRQGVFYELAWVASAPLSPAADEVVIEVRAAALNYRDVMLATGVLPPDAEQATADGQQAVGLECAGVITAIGADVTALQPGDRVCAAAPRSLASHAVTKADLVVVIPETMDFGAAATLPLVYLTVHHSLEHLARLAPGETVLVHGAAGGVGLAAVNYARLVGARVIATAGTPAKRDLLAMLGVEHVFDSRSLAFADEIMALTAGAGVDVVLNSLSGEAITRGLDVLRPQGRFIELGKRDIYANSRIMLRAFRNNIALFCVDISQLPVCDPTLTRSEIQAVAGRVRSGDYPPLPHRTYPAGRIAEAFRLLQQSRHMGKVVVTFDDPVLVELSPEPVNLDPTATYLVTGGLSGVGAAVARGLSAWGARHLALVGRRGAASPEAAELIETLAEQGTTAIAYAADVGDPASMAAVLASVDATGHSLRGVVHGAMQLDDSTLDDMDEARFCAVLAPKMQGAIVLDALTSGRSLDFFVTFSSMTAMCGNFRQANYAAGNLYLEALVRARRARGLPALAIGWAGIRDVGYVARYDLIGALSTSGLQCLTPAQVLDALAELLGLPDSVVCVGDVDWGRMSTVVPMVRTPRLAGLLPPKIEGTDYRRDEFVSILAASTPDDARRMVEGVLAQIVADILQTSPERIDPRRRLDQMGLDSLMSVELVTSMWDQFQCEIPLIDLVTSDNTLIAIAELVFTRLDVFGESLDATPPDVEDPNTLVGRTVAEKYLSRRKS